MKRFRLIGLCTAGTFLLWLGYFCFGTSISRHLAARFSEIVMRATRGNITEPAAFIHNRLLESLTLATFLVVAVWLHLAITKIILRNSANRTSQWITHAASGFILCNVWLGLVMQTTLFWCAMWQDDLTHNLTRFHLKRLLFAENRSPSKAIILGSSQSRAQLDEELLNDTLAPGLHTAELHFPGSNAYDIWLIHRKIEALHPGLIIIYVSEATFYSGNHHDAAANFFQFNDVKDLASRDVRAFVPRQGFQYGLLGAALPIFRLRDVLSQRILGTSLVQLKQQQHNQQFLKNLENNAKKMALGYRMDASSAFEMRAFQEFISDCEIGRETVLVLVGQLNPLLGERFDPKIRADMILFLRQLRDKHANMALIENLPFQSPSDYEDLTHVKKEVQAQFTQSVAELLKRPIAELRSSTFAVDHEKLQTQIR